MTRRNIFKAFMAVAAATAYAQNAAAQTTCTFSAPANSNLVDFSSNGTNQYFSGQASSIDSTAFLGLTCSGFTFPATLSYTITIDAGSSASFLSRTMRMAGFALSYNLYTDVTRTAIWGTGGASGTSAVSGICLVAPCTINVPVYGRLFGGQRTPPGDYIDHVVVTINF